VQVDELYFYREEILRNRIFLTFNGVLLHSFVVKFGEMLKAEMSVFNVDKTLEMKIFSVVIEQAQNIISYSAERIAVPCMNNEMMGVGTILVGKEDGCYFVICGNMIHNENVAQLRDRLALIQGMGEEELKRHYKEQRRLPAAGDGEGSGLGLIDMARKAGRALEFDFRKLDDTNSFFTLKTTI
jgi:hypothetical protein